MAKRKEPTGGQTSRNNRQVVPPPHWGGTPDPEVLDPTPVELPLGACKPQSLQEMVASMLHAQLADAADDGEMETWEEADDFEPEDPELLDLSAYEHVLYPVDDAPPETEPEPSEASEPEPPDTPPADESESSTDDSE